MTRPIASAKFRRPAARVAGAPAEWSSPQVGIPLACSIEALADGAACAPRFGGERRLVIDTYRKLPWWILAGILVLSLDPAAAVPEQSTLQKRTLKEVDAIGLRQAVREQKGRVVFVNAWATWCAPCVAEFPDVVKLHQKYHARGLEVIAVSFDEEAAVAISFLDRQKADFLNLVKSQKQDSEIFARAFDKDWPGALPASWLFNHNGKRQYFGMARFDPVALDKQIAELLAAKQ